MLFKETDQTSVISQTSKNRQWGYARLKVVCVIQGIRGHDRGLSLTSLFLQVLPRTPAQLSPCGLVCESLPWSVCSPYTGRGGQFKTSLQ